MRIKAEMSRSSEILAELQEVVLGRRNLVDSLLPPIVFIILNYASSLEIALTGSLLVALSIGTYRLIKNQPWSYALGGVGGVILASVIARSLGGAEGFFLPGIISGTLTALLCLVSIIIRRPLVAWTSFITRRWPLEWYWHPSIRPAYSEVTLAWAVFFALRTYLQYEIFQLQDAGTLGVVQLVTGWPAMIILLIASYIYGMWRLQNLGGPSIVEFKKGSPPPWQGQKRGF
jgi:hypothetical protein